MRRQAEMERTRGGADIDSVLVFVVSASAREIGDVRRTVADFLSVRGVPSVIVEDMQLVASELATNAVMYGSGPTIEVLVEVQREVRIAVTSEGDVSQIPEVEAWGPVPATAISGRGLGIVRRLADRVDVRGRDGRSTVEVWRGLPDGGPDWDV